MNYKLLLAILMALITIYVASSITIESGVEIITNNATWNFTNDITLEDITIGNTSVVFENDNLSLSPNKTGTNISIVSWVGVNDHSFRLSADNANITYNVDVDGTKGALYYNNTWLGIDETSFIGLATNNILLYSTSRNITITARNLDTNALLENVSVLITGVGGLYNDTFDYSTTITEILSGEYTIVASKPGFGNSVITTDIGVGTNAVTVYLSEGNQEITFTVKDSTSGLEIEGATIIVERAFDGETITTLTTDYTGKASTYLSSTTQYSLSVSSNNYESRSLSFNPNSEDTQFSIYLVREQAYNETIVQDNTILLVHDHYFHNNKTSWALIELTNGVNAISGYDVGLNVNNNHTLTGGTGNLLVNLTIDISNAIFGDLVLLDVNYTTSLGTFNKRLVYPVVIIENATNGGIDAFMLENTGLSKEIAAIIATIIILLFAGVGAIAGSLIGSSSLASGLMGTLATGIFSHLGWIPSYSFYIVAFVIIMFIVGKIAGGNNG